jgi:hypothetical protein
MQTPFNKIEKARSLFHARPVNSTFQNPVKEAKASLLASKDFHSGGAHDRTAWGILPDRLLHRKFMPWPTVVAYPR